MHDEMHDEMDHRGTEAVGVVRGRGGGQRNPGGVSTGEPTAEMTSHPQAAATTPPADLHSFFDEDEDEEWPERGPAKAIRVTWPAAVLMVLLVGAGGIWGGAYMQRHSSSSTSSAAASFRSLFSSGGSGRGASGFSGRSSSSAATGTVTDIVGNVLYVTIANGNLVKIEVGSATTIVRDAKTTLTALQPGDTVVVQGTKASNGTVSASSVTATEAGVSSGAGAFGG